jgi:hypothetical protein
MAQITSFFSKFEEIALLQLERVLRKSKTKMCIMLGRYPQAQPHCGESVEKKVYFLNRMMAQKAVIAIHRER